MDYAWLGGAVFLPLYPFSVLFCALFERAISPIVRAALLALWPLPGVFLIAGFRPPDWSVWWALATAALYGFRLLSVRDMGVWVGFLAVSAWPLCWIPLHGDGHGDGRGDAVWLLQSVSGFGAPLVLLALLMSPIESRLGAAYAFLRGGLGRTAPRLAAVLVFCVLAATATPVFPAFFIMLRRLSDADAVVTMCMLGVWLLWSWAGARLLQGLVVGPGGGDDITEDKTSVPGGIGHGDIHGDIGRGAAWCYAGALVALAAAGVYTLWGRL